MKQLFRIFLPILSLPALSRMWGRIVRIRRPRFLVKRVVAYYRKAYDIDMDEYNGETDDYGSLSDFFIRPLDPEKRPLVPDPRALVSPADGVLSGVETVAEDKVTQVKGKYYTLSQLLQTDIDFSRRWRVAVIYLSPSNYHRYHYPLTGAVGRYLAAGSRLFPVNRVGLDYVDRLFVRNERIVVEMSVDGTPFYFVAVGATNVGSIKMEFIEASEPKPRHQWHDVNHDVRQLQEMGRFEMGSTIVLVFPESLAAPIEEKIGGPVRVGEPVFRLTKHSG